MFFSTRLHGVIFQKTAVFARAVSHSGTAADSSLMGRHAVFSGRVRKNYITVYSHNFVGRDSAVSIVTRYGLDNLGIESLWKPNFPHRSRPALGPTQPLLKWVSDHIPVDKAVGARC